MRQWVVGAIGAMAMISAGAVLAQNQAANAATMIFFDWDNYEVSRDYTAALDAVASDALRQPSATVSVEGNSDRAGPTSANLHSSLRRAQAVRAYLQSKGVPMSAIAVKAWGEGHPLIPTADGVREPQNRRVDVRLIARAGL